MTFGAAANELRVVGQVSASTIKAESSIQCSGAVSGAQGIFTGLVQAVDNLHVSGVTLFGHGQAPVAATSHQMTGALFLTSSQASKISGSISSSGELFGYSLRTSGDLNVTGATSLKGNVTLGDASGDEVTINAETIALANVAAGTDNTVLVYNGQTILTDEIDSRVWGSTLVDGTNGTDNELAIFTDANSVEGDANLTFGAAANELRVVGQVSASTVRAEGGIFVTGTLSSSAEVFG